MIAAILLTDRVQAALIDTDAGELGQVVEVSGDEGVFVEDSTLSVAFGDSSGEVIEHELVNDRICDFCHPVPVALGDRVGVGYWFPGPTTTAATWASGKSPRPVLGFQVW